MQRYGIDPSKPLNNDFTSSDRERLSQAAGSRVCLKFPPAISTVARGAGSGGSLLRRTGHAWSKRRSEFWFPEATGA